LKFLDSFGKDLKFLDLFDLFVDSLSFLLFLDFGDVFNFFDSFNFGEDFDEDFNLENNFIFLKMINTPGH